MVDTPTCLKFTYLPIHLNVKVDDECNLPHTVELLYGSIVEPLYMEYFPYYSGTTLQWIHWNLLTIVEALYSGHIGIFNILLSIEGPLYSGHIGIFNILLSIVGPLYSGHIGLIRYVLK